MGIGSILMGIISPMLESIAPFVPGDVFPHFFSGLFQNALVASVMVTIVAGFLGSFLLVRNLSLIGDGLAHVSFGGICVGLVMGSSSPLWFALVFSTIASILIFEMQRNEILTGDASIAIFLTGMLAFGLVVLRLFGGGITIDVEGYLFGSVLLIDNRDLDLIVFISIFSLGSLALLQNGLLATTIDPLAARVQGIPTRGIGLFFSVEAERHAELVPIREPVAVAELESNDESKFVAVDFAQRKPVVLAELVAVRPHALTERKPNRKPVDFAQLLARPREKYQRLLHDPNKGVRPHKSVPKQAACLYKVGS